MDIIIKQKINTLIDTNKLRFGWNRDIIEYKLISYSQTNELYIAKCAYIEDNGEELIKYVEIKK